eukprot:TRINITY_DN7266_c0_g1_i1.p1 TRINITY_DN7266_c0_g1~~TRINITY_DN7266_c0_g1_i1.p1  ORF type:complete len:404 (+),score=87.16 TRINITY_DN7266_c0_g1_i1:3-1214(+)
MEHSAKRPRPAEETWTVHKFGGTSMSNITGVFRIVTEDLAAERKKGIVVSAFGGVTNDLVATLNLAKAGSPWAPKLESIVDRHRQVCSQLLGESGAAVMERVVGDQAELSHVLRTVELLRTCTEQTLEFVTGFGELWSAQILTAFLAAQGHPCVYVDARRVLVVEHPDIRSTEVLWAKSQPLMDAFLAASSDCKLLVITGYVAQDADGAPTTLKRNGSDFSASIFGALLRASCVTIWTDVDGVFSADPRSVPEARKIDFLTYEEATELSCFGAKVVHPNTMGPAYDHFIPVVIRNTFNPSGPGTTIFTDRSPEGVAAAVAGPLIKGIAVIDICLIVVQATKRQSFSSLAGLLFGALSDSNIQIIMAVQSVSQQCFRFGISAEDTARAKQVLENGCLSSPSQRQ